MSEDQKRPETATEAWAEEVAGKRMRTLGEVMAHNVLLREALEEALLWFTDPLSHGHPENTIEEALDATPAPLAVIPVRVKERTARNGKHWYELRATCDLPPGYYRAIIIAGEEADG